MVLPKAKITRVWPVITGLLLLVAASRLLRLHEIRMNPDEIWSMWQTFGTPQQILAWTPYDWPPLYYLTIGLWWRLTSVHPFALRLLSMLFFLLGTAAVYRVMLHWRDHLAAALAALAYAAMGYSVLLSIEVRGYALLLGLMPLALWLCILYFERPRWWRGVLLALALAAMFYISYTSAVAVLMLGLLTLLVYRRAVWRWWLPGALLALLILPEVLALRETAVARVEATRTLTPGPLPEALYNLFWNWAGPLFPIWLALLALATVLHLVRQRPLDARRLALLVWALVMPLLMYVLNPLLGFFSARYAWWIMLGLALWMGWGLAFLPRAGVIVSAGLLAVMLFYPLPMDQYSIWGDRISPLGENFAWMRERIQWGDVLLADPSNDCGAPEEWDYYRRVYFPEGLQAVPRPAGYRRVWYILAAGRQDAELEQTLRDAYWFREQVGPARCIITLHEAPPDTTGVLFENGMRFHGADVLDADGRVRSQPVAMHEGEVLRLRLWWSADAAIDGDYEITLRLLGERNNRNMATSPAPPRMVHPADAPSAASQWQAGQYYIEERELRLRPTLRSGAYQLFLGITPAGSDEYIGFAGADEGGLLPLDDVHVKAY